MESKPPVIIIGMSRSGTSMLTRMLDALGLFCGNNLTDNHEAVFFRELNDWLLSQCSGGLENPGTIEYLLRDKEARALYSEFISFAMASHRSISYLGLKRYITLRSPARLQIPWGWKDPRNTYTLPFWLDLFPEARVIHIYRHPMDIVNSLMTRRKKGLLRLSDKHKSWKSVYWYYLMEKFIPSKRVFVDLRGANPQQGLEMWREYMDEARKHVNSLGARAMEVKYEDFLDEPTKTLAELSEFTGLSPSPDRVRELTKGINKSRAYAYLGEPSLKVFAEENAEFLKSYSY